ncbi:MAG TPA: tetratricopeptide repeat protein [Ignavibacteria bacterium]|nr:tetratricopeptide repeat protein [Ignavibacteria bacterium]
MVKPAKSYKAKKTNDGKLFYYYTEAMSFYEKYQKQLLYGIIGLVVVVFLVVLYAKNKSAKNEKAAAEMEMVTNIYYSGNFNMAINGDSTGTVKGLQYIVNEYGSTQNGQNAKVMLANSYEAIGDFANAEKYYNDFSGKSDFFKAAAKAGIAGIMENKKEYKEAAEQYLKASKVSEDVQNNDEFIYYAVKNYFYANDQKSVKETIDKLKVSYPKSRYISLAERYRIL